MLCIVICYLLFFAYLIIFLYTVVKNENLVEEEFTDEMLENQNPSNNGLFKFLRTIMKLCTEKKNVLLCVKSFFFISEVFLI